MTDRALVFFGLLSLVFATGFSFVRLLAWRAIVLFADLLGRRSVGFRSLGGLPKRKSESRQGEPKRDCTKTGSQIHQRRILESNLTRPNSIRSFLVEAVDEFGVTCAREWITER